METYGQIAECGEVGEFDVEPSGVALQEEPVGAFQGDGLGDLTGVEFVLEDQLVGIAKILVRWGGVGNVGFVPKFEGQPMGWVWPGFGFQFAQGHVETIGKWTEVGAMGAFGGGDKTVIAVFVEVSDRESVFH